MAEYKKKEESVQLQHINCTFPTMLTMFTMSTMSSTTLFSSFQKFLWNVLDLVKSQMGKLDNIYLLGRDEVETSRYEFVNHP